MRFLRCPHCAGELARDGGVVACTSGHTFDVARQGYVSLFGPHPRPGTDDTADMVAARAAFLESGRYSVLAQAVADTCARVVPHDGSGCVVDVGAGTGYYLARVLDLLDEYPGVALDLSRSALRRAARAHRRIGAVGCDIWHDLPVRSGAAAAVMSVFAPRNGPEIRRVLRPDGALVVVTPTPGHLAELVGPLGLLTVDPHKPQRLHEQLDPHLVREGSERVEVALELGHRAVVDLVAMGPTARHTARDEVARRVALLPDPVTVTASFAVAVHRPRSG